MSSTSIFAKPRNAEHRVSSRDPLMVLNEHIKLKNADGSTSWVTVTGIISDAGIEVPPTRTNDAIQILDQLRKMVQ